MQKLILKRRASGIHAVHELPDEPPLGVINPSELELDDSEIEDLMRRHAAKKMAEGAIGEFLRRINDEIKRTGASYRQAMDEVVRQDPLLASEYRREVLQGSELL